jgi:maltose alpha-D-glucosyltransferase/alpha-amylase
LHLALAAATDNPAFAPEPFGASDVQNLVAGLRKQAVRILDLLKESVAGLPDEFIDLAGLVLGRRSQILNSFRLDGEYGPLGQRMRIHGDYHLGQVLEVRTDYVILDFEGEPARTISERRAKLSPLKDVAGMLRSFDYAVAVAVRTALAADPALDANVLAVWARPWRERVCAAYLAGYESQLRGASFMPATPEEFSLLLNIQVLEKAIYELRYELNNRPLWVEIPLAAIAELSI